MKNHIIPLLFLFIPFFGHGQSFITTWKTDNPGTSNSTSITIPTTGGGYSYDVDWDNDGTFDQFGITGNVTHDFGVAGTYTIRIQGAFPRIYFNSSGDYQKILSIDQWGSISWTSMNSAFNTAINLTSTAMDSPDLTLVTDMYRMFYQAYQFNGDLSNWDVSNVTNMRQTFSSALSFNSDLSNWDVSNVTNMRQMFRDASSFNRNLNNWDVSNVADMYEMFFRATSFNSDLSNWDVGNVNNVEWMFYEAYSFNSAIGNWDVSNVTNMSGMFNSATSFNTDLSNWDVSNVTNMVQMFSEASAFNGDLSDWNVSNVNSMHLMFAGATSFNKNLNNWDVSNVTNMGQTFSSALSFNSDLSNWDVSNVTNMVQMFSEASAFNGDIINWDVSNVSNMSYMFFNASSINQNLGSWDVSAANMDYMLYNSGLDVTNYDNTLIGWENQGITNRNLGNANGLKYCNGQMARNNLISNGWTITGDTYDCSTLPVEFIFFDAYLTDERIVRLIWQTVSEINNSGFEIQKSSDGRNWQIIDFIEGQGTTTENQEYQYQDKNPFAGINYYRLKQVDFDGAFEYSKVIAVEFKNSEKNIRVFPNPSNGLINLQIDNPSNQSMTLKIADHLGRTVWESGLIEGEATWKKALEIAGTGMYFITAQIGDEVYYERVIITDGR